MSTSFLPKLSQNYIELLENDDEYYDTTIEVGEDPNVKIFRAHRSILYYRSPYLRRNLASNKKNINDGVLAHISLPKISPKIFQIILKYIYGGILSLNEQDTSDILKVLVAADELLLQEIIDYLQRYLIENESEWIEQHFELIHRTSFQSNSLSELQRFCTDLMATSPEKIFKSFDFTSLSEKSLVSLIKRDDLQMKEIEVWEHVLKWGLAQVPTILSEPDTWSEDDFRSVESTLQHCLPFIRFFSLSSKEFSDKVRPYQKLLNRQLYEDLLNSYLDPNNEPNDNISFPRNIKTDGIIDSKIVNLSMVSTVSRWIDKVDINCKFAHLRELYLPYKFELLLRGSRDGFTPKKFHTLCDNIHNTITFIKVKGAEEILGGYNPIIFSSLRNWGKTKNSFIFSFKNEDNFIKDAIISNVKDTDCAILCKPETGPYFGQDLKLFSSNENTDYEHTCYNKKLYEKGIRDISGDIEKSFSIEDYEVFQLIRHV